MPGPDIWKRPWVFPLVLGACLVGIEIIIDLIALHGGPRGSTWLGAGMSNPWDTAVYLSRLQQGAEGVFRFKDLFAIEPQQSAIFAFWSVLGLMARTGIPPVLLHELTRFALTILLAFVVYWAARSQTSNDRDARFATLLAFLGIGAGWLYLFLASVTGTPFSHFAPDMEFEFALGPTLFAAGVHIILSVALLIHGLRHAWKAFHEDLTRSAWIAGACFAALMALHPYFIPLIAVYFVLCLLFHVGRIPWQRSAYLLLPFALSVIPAVLIFLPLTTDQVFRTVNIQANLNPLQPLTAWLATLLPFFCAITWRIRRKRHLTEREQWLVIWIISAIICILLPFPWPKRFTEGLGVALVFLTLPAWFAVRDNLHGKNFKTMFVGWICLVLAGLTPIAMLHADIRVLLASDSAHKLYATPGHTDAWDWLREHRPADCVVISDDPWVNIWTPAMTGCTAYIGHTIETPDYEKKYAVWSKLFSADDAQTIETILSQSHATDLLLTASDAQTRVPKLLSDSWHVAYVSSDMVVLERD